MKTLPNKLALSTSCLGLHPSHTLDRKLHAAATHHFSGIEIVYGDLERYSNSRNIPITTGAQQIRHLCSELNLHVLALCPFENFEGTKSPLDKRLEVAKSWLDIARTLRATHMQVPAQYGKEVIADEKAIVQELQALSDLASSEEPTITIAYEPMSWSTCYSTWEDSLRLTEKVDRANFGICLDTFHIASKLWGNPYSVSGLHKDGPEALASSLQRLLTDLPLEKLLYVQLSDMEKFDPPFSEKHEWYLEGEDAEFTWSKWARPFPLEKDLGGYMPVTEIVRKMVLDKGFSGWVSLETFDRRMRDEGFRIEEGARRARQSIEKLEEELQIGQFGKARL